MYLFPCLAPHLHIEIFDTEHKGEHALFANKKTNQKKNTFYPDTKIKPKLILTIL